jgi:hypothetical protein
MLGLFQLMRIPIVHAIDEVHQCSPPRGILAVDRDTRIRFEFENSSKQSSITEARHSHESCLSILIYYFDSSEFVLKHYMRILDASRCMHARFETHEDIGVST